MKISPIANILKTALYLVMLGGLGLVVTLPKFVDDYLRIFYDVYAVKPGYRIFITYFLMLVGSLGIWIVGELISMLKTVPTSPFVTRNVNALRRLGIIATLISALFFLKCCLYLTALTLVFGVFMLICSLFAFTLSDLFRQAVALKEENDLTI